MPQCILSKAIVNRRHLDLRGRSTYAEQQLQNQSFQELVHVHVNFNLKPELSSATVPVSDVTVQILTSLAARACVHTDAYVIMTASPDLQSFQL